MTKRIPVAFLCAMLLVLLLPGAAFADDTVGGVTITGGQIGTDYTINGSCLTIKSAIPLTVTGSEAGFRIVVAGGKTANLTLSGATVDMSASTFAAIDLENGATLNLSVSGINTLKGGEKCAGISAPEGTTLSIGGSGTLNVFGGMYGAGIGGGTVMPANATDPEVGFIGANAGTINISGGIVNATGGKWAAGIGGGAGLAGESGDTAGGSGGTIRISGGTVNVSAGAGGIHPTLGEVGSGAGIGGGGAREQRSGGAGGSITISGGIVNADSLRSDANSIGGGAAIGGGCGSGGFAGNITISGGTVVAEAGLGGAGIGSGSFCEGGGVIRISAGNVTATGGKSAAGVGTGWADNMGSATVTEIIISGGRVSATGGNGLDHPTRGPMGGGAGIGGGYRNVGSNVTISGGVVTATGGSIAGVSNDPWAALTAPSAIGAGSNNSGTHSFTTGQSGSAIINAKTPATPFSGYITDQSNKANWLGVILEGSSGLVYGNQTVNDSFTIDAGQTLTIPAAASFTIAAGVTVTNNGSIVNNGLSRNNGRIAGSGNVTCNNHNWDAATYAAPKTCAFCKITQGEHLPRVRYGIMEGAGGIYPDDKIFFGKYGTFDVPWVVLSSTTLSGASVASGTNVLPLLSEYLLGNSAFQESGSGVYSGGTLNAKMDELYFGTNKLFAADVERNAVADTTLAKESMRRDVPDNLSLQKLFPLSYWEAESLAWGSSILQAKYRNAPNGSAGLWWLRTSTTDYADCVDASGVVNDGDATSDYGVRPALHLDLSKVLFTSAAVGGKTGSGALAAVGTGVTDEWKLTLLDNGTGSGRENFNITITALSATSAAVEYSGAKTGANEYLSAVIVDRGNVIYYGRILHLDGTVNGASGTATINIPAGVTLDADTQLKAFNEQFNGDRMIGDDHSRAYTDYASELLTVTAPLVPSAAIGDVTVSGTTGTAITEKNATITLTNGRFHAIPGDAAVSGWFTNLPAGLSAKIGAPVAQNATIAYVTISGMPTATSTAAMTATIPAACLVGNADLAVTVNANAKWAIVAPGAVETPTFAPPAGTYATAQNVTLFCATTGAEIRYTTDNTDPTGSSTLYTGAIPVTATVTLKARAFKTGMTESAVASAAYIITVQPIGVTVTPSGSVSFPQGGAAGNAVFTVTSSDGTLKASNSFGSATLNGAPLDLGGVGAPGADGSVADGSLIATVSRAKLNTLTPGDYTLLITLRGPFAGRTASGVIRVAAPLAPADVPKTGDGAPLALLCGLILFAGAGLAVSAAGKRRAGKRH